MIPERRQPIEIDPRGPSFKLKADRTQFGLVAVRLELDKGTKAGTEGPSFRATLSGALASIPGGKFVDNFHEKKQKPETNLDRWLLELKYYIDGVFDNGSIRFLAVRGCDAEPVAIVEGTVCPKVYDELERIVGTEAVLKMATPTFDKEGKTIKPEPVHLLLD